MKYFSVFFLLALLVPLSMADEGRTDPDRDILVTFANDGANSVSSGIAAPYRKRKRYSIGADARQHAAGIARDYALVEIDRWPIRALSVFCVIYRPSADADRQAVLARLRSDPRVESAQLLQRFETLAGPVQEYDDTYVSLQRGIEVMQVYAAHQYSRGKGVRVAIVDSHADVRHEDLEGRLKKVHVFSDGSKAPHPEHGTAVASVIGANANNARGIVGIAPDAVMELYVACWAKTAAANAASNAVCDSFTLSKALDAVLRDKADILNLSLTGPHDPLLARLLKELVAAGVVTVAAYAPQREGSQRFPANFEGVIAVRSSDERPGARYFPASERPSLSGIYAPGDQIMVALPNNDYDFRSGNSLSAAHVSGVIALLLAVSPNLSPEAIHGYLRKSQRGSGLARRSIDACLVLELADRARTCRLYESRAGRRSASPSGEASTFFSAPAQRSP
ncbi:MAG: S8 family serine peptidase [Woeseia sp.]